MKSLKNRFFFDHIKHLLAAAELEGDGGGVPVPSAVRTFDVEDPGPLPDINFDDGE